MARDRSSWRSKLIQELRKPAKSMGVERGELSRMLAVELGLFALEQAAPGEPAGDGWALLFGYDVRNPSCRRLLLPGSARWLIGELKSERGWREALETYRRIPQGLRLYDIADVAVPGARRVPSHAATRADAYADALSRTPEHHADETELATAETEYQLPGSAGHTVVIPADVIPAPTAQHDLHRRRRKVRFTFSALEKTADDMDRIDAARGKDNNWRGRVDDLRLFLRTGRGLRKARRLTVEDLVHVVGMPSVGKTTLITVAAVNAARRGHTLTIVLGDVVSVLNMVQDLRLYGAKAAPILGTATRGRHLQQLHRPADPNDLGLGLLRDERLRWVSTACTLQGLMDLTEPLRIDEAPCSRGLVEKTDATAATAASPDPVACPLFYSCGRHEAARELVEARIWVATPPSLLHCRVPTQLTEVSLRYLELAWIRSDAFLVDEADRVQIQWDQAFSPSQVLAGPSDEAWLDEIRPRFDQHVRHTHGKHLSVSRPVRDWSIEINSAGILVARLRVLLASHPHLREWLRQDGYFNEWRLAVRLSTEIARRPDTGPNPDPAGVLDDLCQKQWLESFREWIDKPAARYTGTDPAVAFLRDITARGYDSPAEAAKETRAWLEGLPDIQIAHLVDVERLAVRLQVTTVIALLAEKLARLTDACWEVESETGLESMSTPLVFRPPREYLALVPDAPMGNLLGFQYQEREDAPADQIGTLKFFRCTGIGRWLLLNLPRLYSEDSAPGPGVLLLSATSWAGNSPRYDVQAPVSGILTSQIGDQVSLDERIVMHYLPVKVADAHGVDHDVRVSGAFGQQRIAALTALLAGLGKARTGLRGPRHSRLEEIRDGLAAGRRRVLLLVGSYREADEAYRALLKMRPDWDGQVMQMVPDDDSGTHYWSTGRIARGDVWSLAGHDGVWLLIAPLQAIERGHNILNDQHIAALGAAFFLVRPHLHPEDLNYHVQSMNRWAVEEIRHGMPSAGPPTMPLGKRARLFRDLAHRRWLDQIEESLRYSRTERDSPARRAMDWTNIVPLNQIIGRMLRGGATAQVYFCDGAFAPAESNSPLLGMYRALDHAINGPDSAIATPLYAAPHHALKTLLEKHRATL